MIIRKSEPINIIDLYWLSGLSLVIGGFLATIGWIGFALVDPKHQQTQKRHWFPLNLCVIVGGLLMSLGLPGFYIQQAQDAGLWGLIGFVLLYIGLVLSHLAVHSIETVSMPNVPRMMFHFVSVAAPSLFLGIFITGIVTWSNDVYPQSLGIMITLAAIVGLLTIVRGVPAWLGRNLASCLFPISMVWAGILLLI
ncbi:MAG TPA: hypothetical protein VK856_04110 [Anaerolineaceae bacterium]|nr:hypothetical protein [Anaerolineaceae bacterium]